MQHQARLLFGSDAPSAPTYANPAGLNGFLERQRLVDAEMTPAQILRAATSLGAAALGLSRELGTVQIGKRAKLLRQDPSRTVPASADIACAAGRRRCGRGFQCLGLRNLSTKLSASPTAT